MYLSMKGSDKSIHVAPSLPENISLTIYGVTKMVTTLFRALMNDCRLPKPSTVDPIFLDFVTDDPFRRIK